MKKGKKRSGNGPEQTWTEEGLEYAKGILLALVRIITQSEQCRVSKIIPEKDLLGFVLHVPEKTSRLRLMMPFLKPLACLQTLFASALRAALPKQAGGVRVRLALYDPRKRRHLGPPELRTREELRRGRRLATVATERRPKR